MELYGIPAGVQAQYIYKGIQLAWEDLPYCSHYLIYLNLNNNPKGNYRLVSRDLSSLNIYFVSNELFRERQIVPYIRIYGYDATQELSVVNIDAPNKVLTLNSSGKDEALFNAVEIALIPPGVTILPMHIYNISAMPEGFELHTVDKVQYNANHQVQITVKEDIQLTDTSGTLIISHPIQPSKDSYPIFTMRYPPRKAAITIAKRLDILFKARYREASKVEVWHRLKHGEHCKCWDKYENSVADPNCPICYGVGYVGGYAGPETMYITNRFPGLDGNYNSFGEGISPQGNLVQGIGNMDAYVFPNDIIIDALGNRYIILSVRYSSIDKSVLVSQAITMELVAPNSILYQVGT